MGLNSEVQIILLAVGCLTVSFFTVSANENPEQYVPCKPGWYFFGDKCYKTLGLTEHLNWTNAQLSCKSYGGNLASIHSSELQEFLTIFLLPSSMSDSWIGLRDPLRNIEFSWVDGSVYNYANWDNGEPSRHLFFGYNKEDCVDMGYSKYANKFGKWRDQSCSDLKPYTCQVDKDNNVKSPDPRFCSTEDGGGWKYFKSCIHFVEEEKSWDDAEKYCEENYNGYLVSILDDNFDVFLNFIWNKLRLSKSLWIGIKMVNSSTQSWTSGWQVANTKIYRQGLTFLNGTCVIKFNLISWMIVPCYTKYAFVCEKVKYSVPVLQSPPSEEWKCPDSSKQFLDLGGDSCYYIGNETSQNWLEANYQCGRIGGTLASLHSENETKLLEPHLLNTQLRLMIGVRRNSINKDIFEWADGTKFDYENWDSGEPNQLSEKCGELWTSDMKWNDVSCDEAKGYVCKIKKVFSSSKVKELSDQVPCSSAILQNQTYPSGVPAGTVTAIVFCTLLIGLFVVVIVYYHRDSFRRCYENIKNGGSTSTSPGYLGDISDKVIWKPHEADPSSLNLKRNAQHAA